MTRIQQIVAKNKAQAEHYGWDDADTERHLDNKLYDFFRDEVGLHMRAASEATDAAFAQIKAAEAAKEWEEKGAAIFA